MRRIVRSCLWLIKGALLAMALAALIAWALSQKHGTTITFARYKPGTQYVDRIEYRVVCFGGLTGAVAIREHRAPTDDAEFVQWNTYYDGASAVAKLLGSSWKASSQTWPFGDWSWVPSYLNLRNISSWHRVFYWKSDGFEVPGYADNAVFVGARFWAIALITGFWPMCSIALLFRRRIRKRRLLRAGHCLVCGYDLRATTERCPECGTAAKANP